MVYQANPDRYTVIPYRRCGRSGLKLPVISLGFWHNFGSVDRYDNCRELARTAFDCGITHFDLANNYGPQPGSAEETLGKLLRDDFRLYRDELVISSKAGYLMWPGPYGEWGSRKYLIASCDQSLKRMGLDYVDIFYHHRPDPETPLEESLGALASLVQQGKALYVGISNYSAEQTEQAIRVFRELKIPFLIHQMRCNMFDRHHEEQGLFQLLSEEGIGGIAFSPLNQGILTDRYLNGIPADSRAGRGGFLKPEALTPEVMAKVRELVAFARDRGRTLAQLAIAWVLRRPGMTSALIGASRREQILDAVAGVTKPELSAEDWAELERKLRS